MNGNKINAINLMEVLLIISLMKITMLLVLWDTPLVADLNNDGLVILFH